MSRRTRPALDCAYVFGVFEAGEVGGAQLRCGRAGVLERGVPLCAVHRDEVFSPREPVEYEPGGVIDF